MLPEAVHRTLKARATLRGQTLSDYLRYLVLALRLAEPLTTTDVRLAHAATALGVNVLSAP
jgi:predicted nucleic acid-binding protein